MPTLTQSPIRDQLAEVNRALTSAKEQQKATQREITRLAVEAKRLAEVVENGGRWELAVTEHAMLRYAQRILGFDTSEVLRAVEEKVEPVAAVLGTGKFPIAPGFVAVVQGRTVVTIEPAN